MKNIVCFGEVLWDVFPTHKKIGGAPLNVALRLQSLGNNVSMISRIGTDKKGRKIKTYIQDHAVNSDNVQIDDTFKTGKVKVMLNEKGSASYNIMYPRAWDNIQLTESAKKTTEHADAFVFGSLIARDDVSRHTLYELLKVAKYKIFDVNLRQPYYTISVLNHLMNEADFIKFNDDEIFEIGDMLNSNTNGLEENMQFIAQHTNTKTICVTKGRHGAILYYNDTIYYNSGYHIDVVDTVGAGDSFLASIISKLINNEDPQDAINFACAIGALVAGSEGANPEISSDAIYKFMSPSKFRIPKTS
ncbi:carbohydrate kinase family protein [Winogradskyella bathintestinalis]|uniref:Carbohydrate kinase n=1 Tax=Winogradskyella bathintestinalis TaxID=3035208 RepID=A0ABT7ZT24_9FLAO|nr:carbohydrate kinase [Winogradskyella bathintestinalis]MDN3492181.1 carbohydrate kinase [Winogradskyella bathintestinalis]